MCFYMYTLLRRELHINVQDEILLYGCIDKFLDLYNDDFTTIAYKVAYKQLIFYM